MISAKEALSQLREKYILAAYTESTLCIQTLDSFMKEIEETNSKVPVTPEAVIRAVCMTYSLNRDDLMSESRGHLVSRARKIAGYVIKQNTDLTYEQVAHLFLRDNHTTSMYWCQWCDSQKDTRWFTADLELIYWNIQNSGIQDHE